MANRKRTRIEDVFPTWGCSNQPCYVYQSVVFGDVLLQEIPSPQPLRPRLCTKVDEFTGTDAVNLPGERRAQVVDDGQNGQSKTSIFCGMLKGVVSNKG